MLSHSVRLLVKLEQPFYHLVYALVGKKEKVPYFTVLIGHIYIYVSMYKVFGTTSQIDKVIRISTTKRLWPWHEKRGLNRNMHTTLPLL